MSKQQPSQSTEPSESRFTEPTEAVKRRNRITGVLIAVFILVMVVSSMIVRVYGQ